MKVNSFHPLQYAQLVMARVSPSTAQLLRKLADTYEVEAFMEHDPSLLMHSVQGVANQEVVAFVTSCFSYGSRSQFLSKLTHLLELCQGEMYEWVKQGAYRELWAKEAQCFYRLQTYGHLCQFLDALRLMLTEDKTIGQWLRRKMQCGGKATRRAEDALQLLSQHFWSNGVKGLVPRPYSSASKRPCMFLRWMVRSSSPVDLGLWSEFIDVATLLIPLDTHVLRMGRSLGVVKSKQPTWAATVQLTSAMEEVFPGDPCRADYALFGYGVEHRDLPLDID